MKKRITIMLLIVSIALLMFTLVACANNGICSGHVWDEIEVLEQADCTHSGYIFGCCTKCGVRKWVTVDPYGHKDANDDGLCDVCSVATCDHSYANTVTSPSCEVGGYTTHTCGKCGNSYVDTETDPIGHAFGNWTDNHDGTCSKVCSNDSKHVVTNEHTDEDGNLECDNCLATLVCEHNYIEEVTEPDCDYGGYTTHTCEYCGDSYVDNKTSALGHNFGPWISNGNGTHSKICTYDATHVATLNCNPGNPSCENPAICDACGQDVIPALGHDWSDWMNTEEGYCIKICANDENHTQTHICDPDVDDENTDNVCDVCNFVICDVIGHIDTDEFHDYRCDRVVDTNGTKCGLSTCIEHVVGPAGPGVHIDGTNTNGHHCANCGDITSSSECSISFVTIEPTCTQYGYVGNVCTSDSMRTFLDRNGFIDPIGHCDFDLNGYCNYCNRAMSALENCDHEFEYSILNKHYRADENFINYYDAYVECADFHWQTCTKCGLIQNFELHSYDIFTTISACEYSEGYDTYACVCGMHSEQKFNFTPVANGHFDNDGDYECDNCTVTIDHTCVDSNYDAFCDICGSYDDCYDHEDLDLDGYCDICWHYYNHTHVDSDADCVCDDCYESVHTDEDENHICDACGYEHSIELAYSEHYHYYRCYDCEYNWGAEEHVYGDIIHKSICEGWSTIRKCQCGATQLTDFIYVEHIDNDGDYRCDRVLDDGTVCEHSLCYTSVGITGFTRTCVDENQDYLCDKCGQSVCDHLYNGHVYHYKFDENGHWYYCENCKTEDKTWTEEHSFSYSDTDFGSNHMTIVYYYTCDCGYGYIESRIVDYTTCDCEYTEDADHNNVCDGCGVCLLKDLQYVETVAPTCSTDGYDLYICSSCGEVAKTNYVYRHNNHNYEFSRYGSPYDDECLMCDIYVCTMCGQEKYLNWKEHDFDDGELYIYRCTEVYIIYTCKTCGSVSNQYQPGLEFSHNFKLVKVVAPACNEFGYTLYECQNGDCAYSYRIYDYSVKPTGHNLVLAERFEGNCEEPAYNYYCCSVEGCYFDCYDCDENFEWKEHEFSVDLGYFDPTCEERGYYAVKCVNCSMREITYDGSDSLGHFHEDGALPVEVVEPGVCKNGYSVYVCSRCGEHYQTDFVFGDHSDAYVVDYEHPTCLSSGYRRWECLDCGEDWVEYYPSLGGHVDSDNDCICDECWETKHDHDENCQCVVVDPTYCYEFKYTIHQCINCGEYTEYDYNVSGNEHQGSTYVQDNYNGQTHSIYYTCCNERVGTEYHTFDEDGVCTECGGGEDCPHDDYQYCQRGSDETHEVRCADCDEWFYDEDHYDYDEDGCCDACGWQISKNL